MNKRQLTDLDLRRRSDRGCDQQAEFSHYGDKGGKIRTSQSEDDYLSTKALKVLFNPNLEADTDQVRRARILAEAPTPRRGMRTVVAVGAVVLTVIGLPWLAGSDPAGLLGGSSSDAHIIRDGALGVVVAIAAGLSAWRPHWALSAFAFSAIALGLQLIINLSDGSTASTGINELVHIVQVATVFAIGVFALPSRAPRLQGEPSQRRLKLVDDD